jgi:hypothetical protein
MIGLVEVHQRVAAVISFPIILAPLPIWICQAPLFDFSKVTFFATRMKGASVASVSSGRKSFKWLFLMATATSFHFKR